MTTPDKPDLDTLLLEADAEVLTTSMHADWLDQDRRNADESRKFRRAGSVVRRLATELRARESEGREDRERLDWLNQTSADVFQCVASDKFGDREGDPMWMIQLPTNDYPIEWHFDIRAAIDAAIRAARHPEKREK